MPGARYRPGARCRPGAHSRIEWRPMAREDLRAIMHYIGRDNPARARSFGRTLRDKTKPLEDHPELGHTGRPGLPEGVRELIVHPRYIIFCYIIFYRVLADAGIVEILRVKHAAQQVP